MRLAIAFLVLLLSVVICLAEPGKDETNERQGRTIVISAGRGPSVFGRAALLNVSYRNDTKEPWVVPTPTDSVCVYVYYLRSGTDRLPCGHALGRYVQVTIPNEDGTPLMIATERPPIKPLTIRPGKSHVFSVPLESSWSGHLVPGMWTVWIEAQDVGIESNRLELVLRFSADSVAACLETAEAREEDTFRRKWHAAWLQKIMPGLELNWRPEDTSPEGIARRNAEIEKKLQEFKLFLEDPNSAAAIQQAIGRINQEAGLPVEQKAEEPEP